MSVASFSGLHFGFGAMSGLQLSSVAETLLHLNTGERRGDRDLANGHDEVSKKGFPESLRWQRWHYKKTGISSQNTPHDYCVFLLHNQCHSSNEKVIGLSKCCCCGVRILQPAIPWCAAIILFCYHRRAPAAEQQKMLPVFLWIYNCSFQW